MWRDRRKFHRIRHAPLSNQPRDNELGIGANRRPGQDATEPKLALHFLREILVLRKIERPDFIGLNALAWEVAERFILIHGTSRTEISEQPQDRRFRDSSHANHTIDAGTLHQSRYYLNPLLSRQLIHKSALTIKPSDVINR